MVACSAGLLCTLGPLQYWPLGSNGEILSSLGSTQPTPSAPISGGHLESQGSCIFTSIRGWENGLVGTVVAGQFSDPGCPTWAQFSDPLLFVVGIEPMLLKPLSDFQLSTTKEQSIHQNHHTHPRIEPDHRQCNILLHSLVSQFQSPTLMLKSGLHVLV